MLGFGQGMKWATPWENLFLPFANNKGAGQPVHLRSQPVHLRSLISAFVVRCLDSLLLVRDMFENYWDNCNIAWVHGPRLSKLATNN